MRRTGNLKILKLLKNNKGVIFAFHFNHFLYFSYFSLLLKYSQLHSGIKMKADFVMRPVFEFQHCHLIDVESCKRPTSLNLFFLFYGLKVHCKCLVSGGLVVVGQQQMFVPFSLFRCFSVFQGEFFICDLFHFLMASC